MKKLLFTFFIFHFSFCTLHSLPAFPGAEGFGSDTPGGRGGRVILVTNTNATGPGSFHAAMMSSGPRTIVFRVSGVIQLNGELMMGPDNLSYVTVAGQTSPGGITLTCQTGGATIGSAYTSTRFHDMILRFIRMRVIRESGGNGGDHAFGQYMAHHFILDHCDMSGGDDECIDIGYSRDWTLQWCTVANSGPGGQQYGPLIAYTNPSGGYPLAHITMHHNLIANHNKRGPEFHWLWKDIPDSGKVDFRSNVVYQVLQYGTVFWGVADTAGERLTVNVVGNYWKNGPLDYEWAPKLKAELGVLMYLKDNHWSTTAGGKAQAIGYNLFDLANDPDTVLNIQYYGPQLVSQPWDFPHVTTTLPQVTYDTVLARVGAWPRDSMNRRTVNDVRNKTGSLGQCYDPNITSGPAAPADADNDGMPDFWETGMGLNPNSASDNNSDLDGDGYTNIEEYINDLALARLCHDYYNTVYPIPNDWQDYNPGCCKSLSVEQRGLPVNNRVKLSIHPNPWQGGNLSIRTASDRGVVSIIGIQGREVARFKAAPKLNWGKKDGIAPGVYIVRHIENGKLLSSAKVIITF